MARIKIRTYVAPGGPLASVYGGKKQKKVRKYFVTTTNKDMELKKGSSYISQKNEEAS